MESKEKEYEDVECVECGLFFKFILGHLTEQGRSNFVCHICHETILERRIEEKRIGNRKLLVET